MKKIILLIIACQLYITISAQVPHYHWNAGFGSASNETATDVAIDASSNSFVVGHFSGGPTDFNPGTGSSSLTSAGGTDIYISKFNSAGTFQWTQRIGGTNDDEAHAVACDASGNVYVTGNFQGTVDFDPGAGTSNMTAATGSLNRSVYIVKLNSSGAFVWARSFAAFGGNGYDIIVDNAGDVISTGYVGVGTVDFDPNAGTSNFNAASDAPYIHKMDANGNFIWANAYNSSFVANSKAYRLNCDASNNVFVTGSFIGTIDFDLGTGTANQSSPSNSNIFVVSVNSSGNYLSSWSMGGSGTDEGWGIDIDGNNDVYVSGYFETTVDFDPGTGTTSKTSAGSSDIFIAKYTSAGTFTWVRSYGSTGIDKATRLELDITGDIYAIGIFANTVDFNDGTGTLNFTAAGTSDGFMLKIYPSGNFVTAYRVSNSTADFLNGMSINALNHIWVSGSQSGTTGCSISNTSSSLSNNGGTDAFVIKWAHCHTVPAPTVVTPPSSVCANQATTFSVNAFSGNGIYTYNWSVPSGWTGTSATNTISLTPAGGTINNSISVTVSNSCGNNVAVSVAGYATVNDVPAAPSAITASSAVLCANTSATFSVSAVSGATSYTWTLPGGWTGSSTTNSINAAMSASGGTVQVSANNSCGSSVVTSFTANIMNVPVTPGIISNPGLFCDAAVGTMSVSPVAGASTYNWTLPLTWAGSSSSNSISYTVGSSGGNISVSASNSCGTSTASTLTAVVEDVPATPSAISGSDTVCSGTQNSFSVINDPSADSYQWNFPSGWVGSSLSSSISLTAGSSSGQVQVVAQNACGNSSSSVFNVVSLTAPSTPSSISGLSSFCGAGSGTYSVTADPAASAYIWNLDPGMSGTSVSNSINISTGSSGGNISVYAVNQCGNSSPVSMSIQVNPMPDVTVTASGDTLVSNQAGASSYQWLDCNQSYLPVSGETTVMYSSVPNGSYAVEVSLNGCVDTSSCVLVLSALSETVNVDLSIYPNPAHDFVMLSANEKMERVELLDINGRLVSFSSFNSVSQLRFEFTATAGIYFVRIKFSGSNGMIMQKLVIQ